MIRLTSIETYHQIKKEGLLKKLQLKVYEGIVNRGKCTATEAVQGFRKTTHGLSSRFTELKRMGVIKEMPKRKCSITGRNAITWMVTNELPKRAIKEAPKPSGFHKSITHIIWRMNREGKLFVNAAELKAMLK